MPVISAGDLSLIRTTQNRTKLCLSVSRPRTLLTALVDNGAIGRGATSIPYDGGDGTGFADIVAGQLLKVETATGTKLVRIRSITGDQASGTLVVAANSIFWADNLALTALDDFPLFPLTPRFDSGGAFYKDWDLAYSDQNSQPPPVCIAGPHRVGFLSSGAITFRVDLTDSYPMAEGATIESYDLSVTPSAGVTITPVDTGVYDVELTTATQHWAVAGCTDSNGKSQTTRRRLIGHDPDPADADYPDADLGITTLSGDWNRAGWNMNITVHGAASPADYPEEALVILWAEAWYGATKKYIGGPAGGQNILFAGYIQRDTVVADWVQGAVTFEATTIEGLLREIPMYNISLAAVRSPAAWYEYALWLTPGRAIHHLWRWHSTVLEIADVFGLTGSSLRRKYAEIQNSNLYNMAEEMAVSLAAHLVSNKQGQIHLVQDAQLLDDLDRPGLATVATLGETDYRQLTIVEQDDRAGTAFLSGLFFDGGAVSAYCAKAPGDVLGFRGPGQVTVERQVLASQVHANNLVGRHLAVANNPYPEVRLDDLAGLWLGALDILGNEWWAIDVAAADTTRSVNWSGKKIIPRSIDLRATSSGDYLATNLGCEPEAEGPPGIETACLEGLPADSETSNDPPTWPDEGGDVLGSLVAFIDADSGCYFRDDNAVDWSVRNADLGGADTQDHHGNFDPWWFTPPPAGNGTANPEGAILIKANTGKLFRSDLAGNNWRENTPTIDPPNDWGDSPAPTVADLTFVHLSGDFFSAYTYYVLAEWQNGSSAWRGWLLVTVNNGYSWQWISLYTASNVATRPLWLAVAGLGGWLWLTEWRDGALYLLKYSLPAFGAPTAIDLGSASLAEVDDRTYYAFPVTGLGDDELVFVAGRMTAPAGLAGVQHIIKSVDGGAVFASVESGWDTDHCGAFEAGLANESGDRQFYAVRQFGGT
jgi:hypothetical protein